MRPRAALHVALLGTASAAAAAASSLPPQRPSRAYVGDRRGPSSSRRAAFDERNERRIRPTEQDYVRDDVYVPLPRPHSSSRLPPSRRSSSSYGNEDYLEYYGDEDYLDVLRGGEGRRAGNNGGDGRRPYEDEEQGRPPPPPPPKTGANRGGAAADDYGRRDPAYDARGGADDGYVADAEYFGQDDALRNEEDYFSVGEEEEIERQYQSPHKDIYRDFQDEDVIEEDDGEDDDEDKSALYEAYNLLHTLAQDFKKPFDAPAVVVVGHQSSGKSALIEALMGFQFNQVGGGTKTRRPVALRMQYDPSCHRPRCYLVDDDGIERPKTLSDIQRYIEAENRRLERDPVRCFDSREINVRMEYKHCPNMILIDTPGLIAAPRIPKGRTGVPVGNAAAQQRALLASAREAERLVVSKMRCPDYLILCVEDTMDWKHGATREVVQKADPDLSRTIIVNTKLDTKVPQFGTPSDLADYLRADIVDKLSPHKLGGPFFTSVPSGRVGRSHGYGANAADPDDFLFDDDEDFVSACAENEDVDRDTVLKRLRSYKGPTAKAGRLAARLASKDDASTRAIAASAAVRSLVPRVGLHNLRTFLEKRVDECYRRNVAKIVPTLRAEHAAAERRLKATEEELDSLSTERLMAGADLFCDDFCGALREAVQGSISAPSDTFGETLDAEIEGGGAFNDVQGCPMAVSDRTWDRLLTSEVGNRRHRLYGGSQYHRALREFHLASRCLRLPTITEDEIANAAGVGDTHDGVNFLRASCVIALEKARTSFDPLLEALRVRMCHVMTRLYPIGEYMISQKRERDTSYAKYGRDRDEEEDASGGGGGGSGAADIAQNPHFRELVRSIFDKFIEKCSRQTMRKCQDDLTALTRFVTWDMHERSSGALRRSLPDQTDIVSIYQVAVKAGDKSGAGGTRGGGGANGPVGPKGGSVGEGKGEIVRRSTQEAPLSPMEDDEGDAERDYFNLLQLMEEAACSRDANRTNLVVGGLVQHIVGQWRQSFGRTVATKFNCYFLLPFVDEFHRFLREELRKVYDGDGSDGGGGGDVGEDVFDLAAARRALRKQRSDLLSECAANKLLQEKFESATRLMREQQERAAN